MILYVPNVIDTWSDLLKAFQNVTGVHFLRHSVVSIACSLVQHVLTNCGLHVLVTIMLRLGLDRYQYRVSGIGQYLPV